MVSSKPALLLVSPLLLTPSYCIFRESSCLSLLPLTFCSLFCYLLQAYFSGDCAIFLPCFIACWRHHLKSHSGVLLLSAVLASHQLNLYLLHSSDTASPCLQSGKVSKTVPHAHPWSPISNLCHSQWYSSSQNVDSFCITAVKIQPFLAILLTKYSPKCSLLALQQFSSVLLPCYIHLQFCCKGHLSIL